jgi:hypothetical protein
MLTPIPAAWCLTLRHHDQGVSERRARADLVLCCVDLAATYGRYLPLVGEEQASGRR